MHRLVFIAVITLLSGCGSQAIKPVITHEMLITALIAGNKDQVISIKNKLPVSTKNNNVIKLYLLSVSDKPYELISNSQLLIQNIHHYNHSQQSILKQLLLWAYAHPIYRQETAKQVRLLQRESLLVAPSNIDFKNCETNNSGCANNLREQLQTIISPPEFTEVLLQMAHNDPCINLSTENLGGELGNQCLSSRKGNLKVNLISKPVFLSHQWQAMFNSQ